jgi:hypothetical protein
MTYREYLREHGADHFYGSAPTTEPDDTPNWLPEWENCLEMYREDLPEAQESDDPSGYIDGEEPFETLTIGTIFLTSDGYMVKVSDTKCCPYKLENSLCDYDLLGEGICWDGNDLVLATLYMVE